jgi:hypothetical protein
MQTELRRRGFPVALPVDATVWPVCGCVKLRAEQAINHSLKQWLPRREQQTCTWRNADAQWGMLCGVQSLDLGADRPVAVARATSQDGDTVQADALPGLVVPMTKSAGARSGVA